jgi:excisionase family DNA binding protein
MVTLWSGMPGSETTMGKKRKSVGEDAVAPREIETAQLMTTSEVARWLGISTRTITHWAMRGTIPCTKIGRHWRYRKSDIEAFIQAGNPQ